MGELADKLTALSLQIQENGTQIDTAVKAAGKLLIGHEARTRKGHRFIIERVNVPGWGSWQIWLSGPRLLKNGVQAARIRENIPIQAAVIITPATKEGTND